MLREWTDSLPDDRGAEVWREQRALASARKLSRVEADLKAGIERNMIESASFFEAMRHFITLREKTFPHLPADPAWKILMTLAECEEVDARSSVTGIAYGAGVPMTTALRYLGMMEVEGIVERIADPDDGRRVLIRLTQEGRHRLDMMASQWKARIAVAMTIVPMAVVSAMRAIGLV